MRMKILVFFVATMLAICHGSYHGINYQIFPLRMKTGSGGRYNPEVSCASWRLGVETHNIVNWTTIPKDCTTYVGNYMLGDQYRSDSETVCKEAYLYARSLNLPGDGKDIWVFDIDETLLSNLQVFADRGFELEPSDEAALIEWINRGVSPALPASLKLYNKLLSLGFKVAFLTGRSATQTEVTAKNLKRVGYHTWEKLLLRGPSDYSKTAITFKSAERKKLEEEGYRIVGNIGDQWTDLIGTNVGDRTFKLPIPMYYVP